MIQPRLAKELVKAIYDFAGTDDEDLPFRRGEILEVIEKQEEKVFPQFKLKNRRLFFDLFSGGVRKTTMERQELFRSRTCLPLRGMLRALERRVRLPVAPGRLLTTTPFWPESSCDECPTLTILKLFLSM